jgi:hypothetical protein
MAGGGGAVDRARRQRQRQIHGSSQARTRRRVIGQVMVGVDGGCESASILPAGWPATAAAFTGAGPSARGDGTRVGASLACAAKQACQQKEKAQQTSCQSRRMARSLRTMKSAQPNSCCTCV